MNESVRNPIKSAAAAAGVTQSNCFYRELNERYRRPDLLLQTCLRTCTESGTAIEINRATCTIGAEKNSGPATKLPSLFLAPGMYTTTKKMVPGTDRKLGVKQTITIGPVRNNSEMITADFNLQLDDRLETTVLHNPVFQAFFASNSLDCFKVTNIEHGFAICIIAYLFSNLIHPIVWPNDTKILHEIHLLAYDYYLKSLKTYYETNPHAAYLKYQLRPQDFLRNYCMHNFKMEFEIGQMHTIGQLRSNDRRVYNFEKALRLFFDPIARKLGCLVETKRSVRLIWRLSLTSNLYFLFDPFTKCFVKSTKNLPEIIEKVLNDFFGDSIETSKVWFAISEIRMKSSSSSSPSLKCCDCTGKDREFYSLDKNAIVFQLVLPNEAILFGPDWSHTFSLAYAISTFFYIRNCDYKTQFWTVYDLEQICNLSRSLVEQNSNLDFAIIENIRTEKMLNFQYRQYSYRIEYEFTKHRSNNRLHLLCGHLLCEDQILLKFQKLFTFSRCCLVEITASAAAVDYLAVWKQDSYFSLFRKNGRLTLTVDLRNIILHILKEYDADDELHNYHHRGKSFRLFAIQVTGLRTKLMNFASSATSSLETLAIDLDAPFLADTQLLHYDWLAATVADDDRGDESATYCLTRGHAASAGGENSQLDAADSLDTKTTGSENFALEQSDVEIMEIMVAQNAEVVAADMIGAASSPNDAVVDANNDDDEPVMATSAKKLSKVYEDRIVQDMLEVTRSLLLNSETITATEDVALVSNLQNLQPESSSKPEANDNLNTTTTSIEECTDDLSENNDFYGNEEVDDYDDDDDDDDDGYTTVYETDNDNNDGERHKNGTPPSDSLRDMNQTIDECGQDILQCRKEIEQAERLMNASDDIAAILDEIVAKAIRIVNDRNSLSIISSKQLAAIDNEPVQFCLEEKFSLDDDFVDNNGTSSNHFNNSSVKNKDELSERTPLPSYFEDVIESKSISSLLLLQDKRTETDAVTNDLFAIREIEMFDRSNVTTAVAAVAAAGGIIKDPIVDESAAVDVRKSYLQTKPSDCDCFQSVRVAKKFIKLPDGCQLKCWMAANRTIFYRSRFVNLQMPVFFAKNRFSCGTRIERLLNTNKLTAQLVDKLLFERCSKTSCFSAGLIETSRYSCAVIKTRTRFYLFDCCGCDSIGLALTKREKRERQSPSGGYCCLLRFKSLPQLVQRVYNNAIEQEGFGGETQRLSSSNDATAATATMPIISDCTVSHPILEFLLSSVDVCLLSDRLQSAIYTKPFTVSKFDFRTPKTCGTNIIHGNVTLRGRFVLTYYLKQCHFCCLTAIFTLRLYALPEWTADTIDQVISDGIALFQRTRDRFVQDERVFRDVAIRNRSVLIERAVVVRLPIKVNFALQLQRTLRQFDCLLVQFQCSSFVVCRIDAVSAASCSCYYLFDPYPCMADGRRDPSERGKCCWTRFQTFAELKRRILQNVCNRCDWFCFYRVEIGTVSLAGALLPDTSTSKSNLSRKQPETKKYLKAVVDRVPPWSRQIATAVPTATVPTTEWLVELKNDLLSLWSRPMSAAVDYHIRYPILDEKWISANNIAALIMSTKYALKQWNAKLLDTILLYGKAFVYHNERLKTASGVSLTTTYHGTDWCLYPFKCTIAVRSIIEGELLPSGKQNVFGLMDAFRYFFDKMNYKLGLLLHRFFEPTAAASGTSSGMMLNSSNPKRIEKRIYLAFGKCDREFFMYDCQSYGEPIYVRGTGGSYVLRCGSLDRLINCVRLTLNKTGTFIIHELSVREMTDRMDI